MSLFVPEWNPSRRQLRHCAWATALALAVIAWHWPGAFGGLVLRLAAAGAFAVGTVWPPVFRWPYRALLVVTFPLGWVAGHVLLGLIYFGLITPLALCFRALGRDPLRRALEPEAASYWQPRSPVTDRRRYFHQF
jgi:hypothetical protein